MLFVFENENIQDKQQSKNNKKHSDAKNNFIKKRFSCLFLLWFHKVLFYFSFPV